MKRRISGRAGRVFGAILILCLAVMLAVSGPEPGGIEFKDIARQAGVDFILIDSATPQKHQIETMAGGVAVLDFNNDGWPDIYFINTASQPGLEKTDGSFFNRLYRNNSDGTFTDVTLASGVRGAGFATGVASADYDGDGFSDLFIAGVNRNILYRNRGNGTFEDVTEQAGLMPAADRKKPWSISAGWFDYDNDGLLDLFVVNYCSWMPEQERPCQIGTARTYCHPRYYDGLPNTLYHNNGDGTFTDVSKPSGIGAHVGKGMAVSFLDFDQDGRLDAFVANDTVPNFLFHNEGGGRFTEVALLAGVALNDDGRAVSSMGVDVRDIDNDGREDIFVTANHNETFPLFRGLAKGLFSDIAYPSHVGKHSLSSTGWGNGAFDFDNDGYKDLFAACGSIDDNVEAFSSRKSRQPNLLLANLGNGRFRNAGAGAGGDFQAPGRHRGAAFGDFDRDGRVDVVVTRIGEPAELFRNVSAAKNHWIAVQLKGRDGNTQGIGSEVHIVTASGREQWNRMTTATGYASSSEPVIFFGLGGDSIVERLDIRWPSGTRQTLRSLSGDRYLTVEDPASRAR